MLATASLAVLCLVIVPASAQSTQDTDVETVVVTGTHIAVPGFRSPTPVTSLSTKDLQATGTLDGTELAYQLPQLIPNVNTQYNGAQAGATYFNLRNLGATRTLILLNGHRVMPTSYDGTTDANIIPLSLVTRIDNVTGGASAAYGSDAITGVMNFVLNDQFEGFKASAQWGQSQYNDNEERNVSLTYGTSFAGGRGHVVVAAEAYSDSGADLDSGRRPWADQGVARVSNPNFIKGDPSTGYQNIIIKDARWTNSSFGGLIVSRGPLRFLGFGPGGSVAPLGLGTLVGTTFMQGGSGDYLWDKGSLTPKVTRESVFTHVSYDISDSLSVFGELSILHKTGGGSATPNPDQGNLTIYSDNPYIPAPVKSIMTANNIPSFVMGRTNLELGFNYDYATYYDVLWMAGAKGKFSSNWTWVLTAQFSSNAYHVSMFNDRNTALWHNAVNVVANPAVGGVPGVAAGLPVCRASLPSNPGGAVSGCVPINVFGPNMITPAQAATVTGTSRQSWPEQSWDISGNVQGVAFHDWAGDVAVAAGGEIRRLSIHGWSDPTAIAKLWFSANNLPFTGAQQVEEGYVETDIPLLRDVDYAKDLSLNGAFRYTNYSQSGGAETWKLGLNWTVNDELRLRFTNSHDLRAPSLNDLYSAAGASTSPLTDPRVVPSTGMTYGTYSVLQGTGGNPNLTPEVGITNTGGVVYSPSWLPGLTTTLDYWAIHLHNAISSIGATGIVNGCFLYGQTNLCPAITLGGNSTSPPDKIVAVQNTRLNNGTLQTNGVDFEVDYAFDGADLWDFLPGNFILRALGTYTDNYKSITTNYTGAPVNTQSVGMNSNAKWRGNATLTWSDDPLSLSLMWRYAGATRFSNIFSLEPGVINSTDQNGIGSRQYFGLSGTYDVADHWQLFAGVNNLLNTAPPISPNSYYMPQTVSAGNQLYDVIGRTYRFGVRANF
jgi:outer membrane receptor protein involved in Fe transport